MTEEPIFATPEELKAMNDSEYLAWIRAGSHMSYELEEEADIEPGEREHTETEEQEESRAERERKQIYGQPPFQPTLAEIEAMTVEQHKEWVAQGGHRANTAEETAELEAKAEGERQREAELKKIEGMSIAEYFAYRGEITPEQLAKEQAKEAEEEAEKRKRDAVRDIKAEEMDAYAQKRERDKEG